MHYRIFNKSTKQEEPDMIVYQDGRILSCYTSCVIDDPNLVVEPWTGFRDINGKMIYLHDILEFIPFQHKVSIQWEDGAFKCVSPRDNHKFTIHVEGISKYTVVGHL